MAAMKEEGVVLPSALGSVVRYFSTKPLRTAFLARDVVGYLHGSSSISALGGVSLSCFSSMSHRHTTSYPSRRPGMMLLSSTKPSRSTWKLAALSSASSSSTASPGQPALGMACGISSSSPEQFIPPEIRHSNMLSHDIECRVITDGYFSLSSVQAEPAKNDFYLGLPSAISGR